MMKAKLFLIAALVMILGACKSNKDVSLNDTLKYIPKASLSEEQISGLKTIFSDGNDALKQYSDFHVIVLHSIDELRAICPKETPCPQIDFSTQSLIFAPVVLSSINDEIINNSLYYNTTKESYELHVEIRKCTECYDMINHTYAYGVFVISPNELKQINSDVQLSNR